jgi:hypothetical protein
MCFHLHSGLSSAKNGLALSTWECYVWAVRPLGRPSRALGRRKTLSITGSAPYNRRRNGKAHSI